MDKLSVDELLRQACLYAEQDRMAFVDAHERMADDPAAVEAREFLAQLKAYRLNRWGRTKLEHAMDMAKSVAKLRGK